MGHTPPRSWHWAAVRRSGWCNAGCNAGCWSQDGVMPGAGARYNEDWSHPSVTSKHSMTGPLGHQCSAVRGQEEESRIMSGVPIELLIHQGDKLQVGMQRSDRGCMQMQSRGRYCKLSLTTDDDTIMIFYKELHFWSREPPWQPRFYITVMHARTWAWKYCIFVDWRAITLTTRRVSSVWAGLGRLMRCLLPGLPTVTVKHHQFRCRLFLDITKFLHWLWCLSGNSPS